jgi:hypothetical protein
LSRFDACYCFVPNPRFVDFSKYLTAYTFAQVMAVTRINICKNGMMSLSRSVLIMYYTSVFIYFWIFSTPVVSLIFGSYLYICINWFHIHFDEAFSSLRIANYKSFTRFHVKKDGDLEIFTLAVDKVTDQPSFRCSHLLITLPPLLCCE